jgi:hypothetical protein
VKSKEGVCPIFFFLGWSVGLVPLQYYFYRKSEVLLKLKDGERWVRVGMSGFFFTGSGMVTDVYHYRILRLFESFETAEYAKLESEEKEPMLHHATRAPPPAVQHDLATHYSILSHNQHLPIHHLFWI